MTRPGTPTAEGRPAGARLLDPAVISRLAHLSLKARTICEGVLTGIHKSPHHGSSIEFAEHKEYSPGDDIRHVDWKAYGRLDKFYVKRFEDETNLKTHLLVDRSGSMHFQRGAAVTKLEYARCQAAALAYLLVRQQDAAGISLFTESIEAFVPPRGGMSHLNELLAALDTDDGAGARTDLPRALDALADRIKGRALVIVFSDLLEETGPILAALKRIRARRSDVVVFHLLDPDEQSFPFDDLVEFEGLEGEGLVLADCQGIRDTYRQLVDEHIAEAREALRRGGVEYHFVTTDRPYDEALAAFLQGRMRG